MKVLLVRPEESRSRYDFQGVIENECLELEWIQRILQDHGHEVTIFDKQVETLSFSDFIKDKQFDVFYGEARCFQEPFILEYVRAFKNRFDGITILGGIHAQMCKERLFIDEVDYVLLEKSMEDDVLKEYCEAEDNAQEVFNNDDFVLYSINE